MAVHVARFSRQYFDIMEMNNMVLGESVFCYSQFFWLYQPYVLLMLFYPGLNGMTFLSKIHFTTFTGDTINPRSLQSKVILNLVKKFEDILMWKSNTLDVISGQHSVEPSIGSLYKW
jgi:hypothetical protein